MNAAASTADKHAVKRTYEVTAPDGAQITRKTARTYTHVVLVQYQGNTKWSAAHWCGSLALAQKYNYGVIVLVNNPR